MLKPAFLLAGLAVGVLPAAAGAACLDDVDQLAKHYDLSLSPTTPEGNRQATGAESPVTTESRGLAGPDTKPPGGGPLSTPGAGAASAPRLDPHVKARMEGLLAEARAAQRQGNAIKCRDDLAKARALPKP